MPPLYEFNCPFGHTFVELVPIGTKRAVCNACAAVPNRVPMDAERILSPTRTTFQHADRKLKL